MVDSDTTTYTLDVAGGLPHVIVETTGSDSDLYLTGLAQFQNNAWVYQHADGLGSVRQLTDSSVQVTLAQTYDPFGNLLEQSGNGASGFGYTGEQEDASTGLVFLRARYYDPSTGRFISKDTFSGFAHQPGTQHPYVYVTNNPVRYTDPSGHCILCLIIMEEVARRIVKDSVRKSLFDDRIHQSLPNIPFTNVAEAVTVSLLGEDRVYLGGDAIDLIRDDPAFRKREQELFTEITSDPRYMQTSFPRDFGSGKIIKLGGEKNEDVLMKDQLYNQFIGHPLSVVLSNPCQLLSNPRSLWTNEYQDTWKVAANELSWLLRSVRIDARAMVNEDGSFTIIYHIEDTLDLKPHKKSSDSDTQSYNVITAILGGIYHYKLGATFMKIEANWSSQFLK